ncbi:putative ATP-dependent endonuclease of OLD family [Variovorax boronicumulans]|uniref:AAA family ATPase n=1 Tax=Variovorax boronicumulans TaxID=436515 RepID=UPI002786E34F|nr:putative ATP-dependent endonuclease of OLD family [Variovorax boronicumulans]
MQFNKDINILTGRNGSGKTSILKLIWYIVSGNILYALREVDFKKVTLVTSLYSCTVHRASKDYCKVDLEIDGEEYNFVDISEEEEYTAAESLANQELIPRGRSVFLPTFRRIEGGFTIGNSASAFGQQRRSPLKSDIEDALVTLSKKLTNGSHAFICSISTVDVVQLLLQQYTNLSDLYADVQQKTSAEVIQTIKDFKNDRPTPEIPAEGSKIHQANMVIDSIKVRIESMEKSRETIMTPIEAVKSLIQKLFKHGGIKIGRRLNFGDAATAIDSDALSAGEKQMLSFICYNAFYKDSVMIIDEPELSLHVDWQRMLFPILQSQKSSNQFIIATHSPFIYSKYPDKEICIDQDRGDEDASNDAEGTSAPDANNPWR